jgi:hypothetical protein
VTLEAVKLYLQSELADTSEWEQFIIVLLFALVFLLYTGFTSDPTVVGPPTIIG